MLSFARFLAGLLLIFFTLGLLGSFLGENASFATGITAVPLVYFAWLVWQTLKPVDIGLPKFCLAHIAPGSLIAMGLVFLFAPNKVEIFMMAGAGLITVGIILIHQMYLQRKVVKFTPTPKPSYIDPEITNFTVPVVDIFSDSTEQPKTKPDSDKSNQSDDDFDDFIYAKIGDEINSSNKDFGIWTKAYSEARGDDKLTQIKYIEYRLRKLRLESNVRKEFELHAEVKKTPDKANEDATDDDSWRSELMAHISKASEAVKSDVKSAKNLTL